ncbi:MAG: PIN domain-containing protein [Candidatus Woesearchaeota archaeon]
MNRKILFFDTYAFFEIIRGNPEYKRYEEAIALTSIFNLAELNYGLKKEFDKKTADKYTDKYTPFLVETNTENIKEAMSLKLNNKKISIPDAVGYTLAKKFGVKFLTGDKEFENMPHVEFVK